MKNNIAKIRAALEMARDYITSDLASERGAFEGHEGVSRIDEIKADLANNAAALAALAELEKAAADPVGVLIQEIDGSPGVVWADVPAWGTRLYAAPPAPVAEIREVAVTDEMVLRISEKYHGIQFESDFSVRLGRDMISAVRAELGPALGLVELKEPSPEECERICTEYERLLMREGTCGGRDAFDAVFGSEARDLGPERD